MAMVDDEVNDARALAHDEVGIAIGAGAGAAFASIGIILASTGARSVPSVVELSRAVYREMKQTFWLAAAYNRRDSGADAAVHYRGRSQLATAAPHRSQPRSKRPGNPGPQERKNWK